MKKQLVHYYFASTPLHIVFSASIALQQPGKTHVLCIIDQKKSEGNDYEVLLSQWQESPFFKVVFLYRHDSFFTKLSHRNKVFSKIKALIDELPPEKIYTGSDRRVEFQYAMHIANKHFDVEGIYIDEGTFSYSARKASAGFGDMFIDNMLKKLFYGFWWKNPPTTGGSKWIKRCLLMYPEHANSYLKRNKLLEPLYCNWLKTVKMNSFFSLVCSFFDIDIKKLSTASHIITLSHESLFSKMTKINAYKRFIENSKNKENSVCLKLHPRNTGTIPPFFNHLPIKYIIKSKVPFEAVLPFLKESTKCLGDISTAIMTTKWLRPDCAVFALKNDADKQSKLYQQTLKKIGVNVTN